jgi:putative endonuclease
MRAMLVLPVIQAVAKPFSVTTTHAANSRVYILELAQGRVYVGKSCNVERRIAQHASGTGAAFTRAFPPTGNRLHRLGDVQQRIGDAAERDETIRYMFLRGIDAVRGWRYCTVELSQRDRDDAEANIRELFDLCRRCGNGSHFMRDCKFIFDRFGREIKPPATNG